LETLTAEAQRTQREPPRISN